MADSLPPITPTPSTLSAAAGRAEPMHAGAHDDAVAALRLLTGGHEICRDEFDLNYLDGEVSDDVSPPA